MKNDLKKLKIEIEEKLRRQEQELREALAGELESEHQELQKSGLAEKEIKKQMNALEAEKRKEYERQSELLEKQAADEFAEEEAALEKNRGVARDLKIKNKSRAGQAVSGVSGKPVEFDEKGIAIVDRAEFEHFLKVPGYKEA